MFVSRLIQDQLTSKIGLNKVLLLFGTRRVGKTFLLKQIEKSLDIPFIHFNAEDNESRVLLENRSAANYKRLIGDHKLVIIDEAPVIPEVGKCLKLMIDEIEGLTIIATGSSVFDLSNKTGEPLTGRSYTHFLYPVAQIELSAQENFLQTMQSLDERLIFGSYPEVLNLNTLEQKADYLKDLVNSYLLKDILVFEKILNSNKILDLLKLVAYQVGSEVSYDELAKQLGMSKNTVERYLDLLAKVQILFRLSGYSSNLRKEVTKSSKWYFYDNGIRNAILNDFKLPATRLDIGALWENYCLYERIKKNTYLKKDVQYYFWRTYDKQELDLIELESGNISAVDFKWGKKEKRAPAYFSKSYPNAEFQTINRENYLDFIA